MSDLDIPDARGLVDYLHEALRASGEPVVQGLDGRTILRHRDVFFEVCDDHRGVSGPYPTPESLLRRRGHVRRENDDGSSLMEWSDLLIATTRDGSFLGDPAPFFDWLEERCEVVYSDQARMDSAAGSGGFRVYRWRDWYILQDDFDGRGLSDSFRTLDQAITEFFGGLHYQAESEITSTELTYDEFVERFEMIGDLPSPDSATPSFNGRRIETQSSAMTTRRNAEVRVLAAVIRKDDRYLICKRPDHKRHGGLWEFPGGKIEDGETDLQAAVREMREELDVGVESVGPALFARHDDGSVFRIEFMPVEICGRAREIEHSAHAWARADELLSYDLAPSDRAFVEAHLAPSGERAGLSSNTV
jgi:mutator protein MutT